MSKAMGAALDELEELNTRLRTLLDAQPELKDAFETVVTKRFRANHGKWSSWERIQPNRSLYFCAGDHLAITHQSYADTKWRWWPRTRKVLVEVEFRIDFLSVNK